MKRIPENEFIFSYSRASGKGGQHVNKTSTRVTCKWNLFASAICNEAVVERFQKKFSSRVSEDGFVSVSCGLHRSQSRNREECIARLHEMLWSVWQAPKARKKTKPKKSSIYKRLENKKKHSDKKKSRQKIKY